MPREEEALLHLIRSEAERVKTTFPGKVVSYDRTTQTAAVQVVPRLRWRNPETDEVVHEQVPVLPQVPILFPAGKGVSITWDLDPGDEVWVVLGDRSIAEWKSTGNGDTEPAIPRRWDFSDAVAIPGGRPPASPLGATAVAPGAVVVRGADIRLGSATATEYVALSTQVLAQLTALAATLAPLVAVWTATQPAGGPIVAPASTPMPAYVPSSVAATKVKAE